MQRAQYHSYFGLKPREMPTAGPGAYESQSSIRSSSAAKFSPGKGNRSMISETRAKNEKNVGPGRYDTNLSTFKSVGKSRNSYIPTFGTA